MLVGRCILLFGRCHNLMGGKERKKERLIIKLWPKYMYMYIILVHVYVDLIVLSS